MLQITPTMFHYCHLLSIYTIHFIGGQSQVDYYFSFISIFASSLDDRFKKIYGLNINT